MIYALHDPKRSTEAQNDDDDDDEEEGASMKNGKFMKMFGFNVVRMQPEKYFMWVICICTVYMH